MLWSNGLKILFRLALGAGDMSTRQPYEAFAWHSATPRWHGAKPLLITALCTVCVAAGYMAGQAKPEAVDVLAESISSNRQSYARSASSPQSDLDPATRQASPTAHTRSSTLQETAETDAPRVVLLNPSSADGERQSERKSERSGSTANSQRLNSEVAPAARKRKKVSLPRRQEKSLAKAERASSPEPLSGRAPSPKALSFRQDKPLRDYRDLREQLFR
jgi:hypothetical protein